MKLLRITTRIHPDIGGPALQADLLSRYCSKYNIKVFNIASSPKKYYKIKEKKVTNNYKIYFLRINAPNYNASIFKSIVFFIKFFILGFIKAVKIHRKYRIDAIHSHTPAPTGYIAILMSKIFQIPFFYTIHGIDYPFSFLFHIDIKIIAKNSKKTIVVSRKIEHYIKLNYNLQNVFWLPNGIETIEYFHVNNKKEKENLIKRINLEPYLSKDDLIITYIGYMIFFQKVRGMLDFLKAFKEFIKSIPSNEEKSKLKLIFVGGGTFFYMLEKEINQLKLNNNVFLLGERKDLKYILAITDLLALTSYIEGFPNAILEAMASRVPCLATNVGEIKYIIDNTGYIVNPGDINEIEKKLMLYYNLKESVRNKLREEAFTRVRELFDINNIIKKLIQIYHKC